VVEHQAPALDDSLTAQAVSSAVRLTMTHVRLQEEQQQRLADMAASRLRLLEATDRARAEVATELRSGVGSSLMQVREVVTAVRVGALRTSTGTADARAVAALDIVLAELQTLDREIGALVDGVLPFDLGEGRLTAALQSLADGSPVECTLRLGDAVGSDAVAEATLYYVCSEALANAVKHARSSAVEIDLRRTGADLVLTVTDDGVGGADPQGSGLRGLADRVAAHGGRLRVASAPGSGTVVSGSVPALSRSVARA
jgi:signal transduction histidine kinase